MAATAWARYQEWLQNPANRGVIPPTFEEWQRSDASNTPGAPQVNAEGQPSSGAAPAENPYNPDGSSKNGAVPAPKRNADGGLSPQTFEERLGAGEFAGNEGKATELEVTRRRRLISDGLSGSPNGFEQLPPDVADVVMRDGSGRVRKARGGSTRSALGVAFSPTAPIGPKSLLGGA